MKHETGKKGFAFLLAGCLILLLPGLSLGWDQEQWREKQEMRQTINATCGESLETFCSDERERKRIRCLIDHYEETSAECQAVLDEAQQRREQERARRRETVAAACGESKESLCATEDGPELIHCLFDHYEETSAECQTLLDEIQKRRRARRGWGG